MKRSLIKRKLGRVEKAVDRAIDKAEIPGAVVLARMPREGEMLEHSCVRGHAVLQPERLPMTRETLFDLASLTKPIATATAIALLLKDGAISLDDPVSKLLPAFADRDKDAVTLRHLLSHSAGLKPWRAFHELLIQRERKTGERILGTPEGRQWILDRVIRSALVHEPGEAAVYGDLDFIALGAVVEAVAEQSLDRFCAARIFGPLGMKDTRFLPLPVDGSSACDAIPTALRRRPLGRSPRSQRVGDGGRGGSRGLVLDRRRRDDVCPGVARRLARTQRTVSSRAGPGILHPAAPARGLRLGLGLGHPDARGFVIG